MTAALVLLAIILAAYRVTRFLVEDDLLAPARERVFAKHDPAHGSFLGRLISCPFCEGFWVCGAMLAVAHLAGLANWPLRYDLVLWWAVAGGQAMLSAIDGKLGR